MNPRQPVPTTSALGFRFRLLGGHSLFNFHVVKLFRVKDFAAFQALDKFDIIMPGNDADAGVFANGGHTVRLVERFLQDRILNRSVQQTGPGQPR